MSENNITIIGVVKVGCSRDICSKNIFESILDKYK